MTKVTTSKYEAESGKDVPIYATDFNEHEWDQVDIEFIVYEYDSGNWQLVGESTETFKKTGNTWPGSTFGGKEVVINEYEGKVTIHYNISLENRLFHLE